MKTVYSMIISLLLLFATISFSSVAGAVVCQSKTAIVFSNGMFNTKKSARDALAELQERLISSSSTFADPALYEYSLAFASDGSQYRLNGTNPIIKLANSAVTLANGVVQTTEVVLQKVAQDNFSAFWRWTGGLAPAGSRLQSELNNLASAANSLSFLFDPDLQRQVADYTKLLNGGKRIVIVSHSQGNFYANAAYSALTLNTPVWANSLGIVQVATPAASNQGSKLGNNEPQITVPEDMVMAATQRLNPWLTMPTKPVSGLSRNFFELGGTSAYLSATGGHNFVTWYLAGTDTRNFIMKGNIQTISGINGVGGLQYPTQGCTPPVAGPVVTVPQPGPYYFRDDWGVFTFYMSGSNRQSHMKTRSAWARFKNLRDEQKGLAYHVDLDLSQTAPYRWQLPEKASVLITDYTSLAKQTLPVTFSGSFKPQDVLLWKGGLIFLSFDHQGYDALTAYHRDNIVRVSWQKLTIVDHGTAGATRWTLKPVQSGVFSMPTYTVAQQGWGTMPNGRISKKWVTGNNNQWNKLGVFFRDAMTYTYRIPFSASEANWTNTPSTPFGLINGVLVEPPYPIGKNYLGDYGALEVVDGVLSFTHLGQVALHSTGTKQSGVVPQINTFGGIEQTRAYQNTQGIVKKAALVEEASQLNWRMAGNPPAAGAPPLGMLKATLPANGLFFNPRTWTRYYGITPKIPNSIFQVYTYSQIFVPYSLSNQMAGATVETVFAPKINVNQVGGFYKLGKTLAGKPFAVPYNTYPFPIPAFSRGNKNFYCAAIGVTPCFPGGIYGISVSAAQQAAMISPVP